MRRISPKIKEKGKHVRQVELGFDSLVTKHLWTSLRENTINPSDPDDMTITSQKI